MKLNTLFVLCLLLTFNRYIAEEENAANDENGEDNSDEKYEPKEREHFLAKQALKKLDKLIKEENDPVKKAEMQMNKDKLLESDMHSMTMVMKKSDHIKTQSWGNSELSEAFTDEQALHLANGEFKEAFEMALDQYDGATYEQGKKDLIDMGSRKGLLSAEDRKYLDEKVRDSPRMGDKAYKSNVISRQTNKNKQGNKVQPRLNSIFRVPYKNKSSPAGNHQNNGNVRRGPG